MEKNINQPQDWDSQLARLKEAQRSVRLDLLCVGQNHSKSMVFVDFLYGCLVKVWIMLCSIPPPNVAIVTYSTVFVVPKMAMLMGK